MNILEARRRVLGGEVYKKTAEGNPISVRSLARMRPGLSIMGKSTQNTTTGAQLFNFSNAMQKIIDNWNTSNILSAPDTNDISIQWENLSGQAQSHIAIVCPFSFESGKTIYITRGVAQRFLVYDNDGQNIANTIGETYTPNERFDGYVGIGIDIGRNFNSPLVITYDKNFSTAEPYTGGQPSPSPDYPQEIHSAGEDGDIQVDVTGANLFDISKATPSTSRPYMLDISKDDEYIYVTGNPNSVHTILAFRILSYPTLIYGNRFSADFAESQGINAALSYVYQNDYDMSIALRIMLLEAGNPINLKFKIMVNEGNETLPYEPYKQPQSLIVSTPNGLPGIPVDSGGNYTDENGQQWICDEIDFKRGKYVQRVEERIYGENENVSASGYDAVYTIKQEDADHSTPALSNMFIYIDRVANGMDFVSLSDYSASIVFGLSWITGKDAEAAKNWFAQKYAEGNPVKVLYVLATPIETDLSQEQMAAYANLHTNRPTTVVSATDGAGMKLTYKTKKSLEVTD